jgi:ribosomal protein S18 acetylase RimI-like enzyme
MISIVILIICILILICLLFFNNKETFVNTFRHPKLIESCFSKKEVNSFEEYYKFSKIVYGKDKKSICYLTPTKMLNDIPIISWNGYYINNFCVGNPHRNKGYGTNLIKKIEHISKKEGKDHLILQVNDDNEPSKQLYYNNGFMDHSKGMDKDNTLKLFLVKYI